MKHQYTIERHDHGWLLCAPPYQRGIPLDAINKCLPLFPKNSVMNAAIAHHYNTDGHKTHVVVAISTIADGKIWESEIATLLLDRGDKPHERWWKGTDVGTSSATIFGVLADVKWLPAIIDAAREMGNGSTPRDSADFARCSRLLDLFPEWRARLPEVAVTFPDTQWPHIIARWSEIEYATSHRRSEILRSDF